MVDIAPSLRCSVSCTCHVTHSLKVVSPDITSWLARVGNGSFPGYLPYGEAWRERRRMFTKYFHPGNTDLYEPTQREFVRKMLPQLLKDPENFLSITRK